MDTQDKIGKYILDLSSQMKGANGEVYICHAQGIPDVKYALKVYKRNREQALHEINLSKILSLHENIVRLVDSLQDGQDIITVYEYCPGGQLMQFIEENDSILSESDRVKLFAEIVSAFQSIYEDLQQIEMTFQHRDIKPDNILLGAKKNIKVIDLGESRIRDQSAEGEIPTVKFGSFGTPNYMDPNMIKGLGFNMKSDIYSLGITFYEMLFNERPYDEPKLFAKYPIRDRNRNTKVFEDIRTLFKEQNHLQNRKISADVRNCLNKMLAVDQNDRYGWKELFNDPLIQQFLNSTPTQTDKKKSYKVKQAIQLDSSFASIKFKGEAGDIVVDFYYVTMFIGSLCASVADKLITLNNKQRELYYNEDIQTIPQQDQRIIFLKDWQTYEKAVYLLFFRSFMIFNHFNYVLTQKMQVFNGRKIEKKVWDQLNSNSKVYERVAMQIYHLFEDCRKLVQGSGVEGRISLLKNVEECEDYKYLDDATELNFREDERKYFAYKHNCDKNYYNKIENFEDEGFYKTFSRIVLKILVIIMEDLDQTFKKAPNQRNQDEFLASKLELAGDIILALTLEKINQQATMQKMNDYRYNMNEMVKENQEVLYCKLKIITLSLQQQIQKY